MRFFPRAVSILRAALLYSLASAQCPQGSVTLASQAEVDAFATNYPNCTAISGDLTINGPDIVDLAPFDNLATVSGDLWIRGCPSLTSISGFTALDTVGMNLNIWQNDALTTVNGFPDLKVCGNTLLISENPSLTSISGFGALDSLGSALVFSFNPLLTDISAFDHPIVIPTYLEFVSNPSLSPCNVQAICDHVMDPANTAIFIQGNAPGCATLPEVIASCISTAVNDLDARDLAPYPDPTRDLLHIQGVPPTTVPVFIADLTGKCVAQTFMNQGNVDVRALTAGVYFLHVPSSDPPTRIRFVRE